MTEEAKRKRAEYMKQYREKNKDRLNQYRREWNARNPEKILKYQETYWNKVAGEKVVTE